MLGCLRRVGCLALVLVIAAGLWLTRDRWWMRIFGDRGKVAATSTWHPISRSDAGGARATVASLGRKGGPVFVNLGADELGALLISSAGSLLSSAVSQPQIAISGDRVLLKGMVLLRDLKGVGDLGPFSGMLDKQEPFEASGTLDLVHPGLAEYRVESARLGELSLPRALIPKLVTRSGNVERYHGVADNGIPFEVPSYIGDVRVAQGRVTLYKNVQ